MTEDVWMVHGVPDEFFVYLRIYSHLEIIDLTHTLHVMVNLDSLTIYDADVRRRRQAEDYVGDFDVRYASSCAGYEAEVECVVLLMQSLTILQYVVYISQMSNLIAKREHASPLSIGRNTSVVIGFLLCFLSELRNRYASGHVP